MPEDGSIAGQLPPRPGASVHEGISLKMFLLLIIVVIIVLVIMTMTVVHMTVPNSTNGARGLVMTRWNSPLGLAVFS